MSTDFLDGVNECPMARMGQPRLIFKGQTTPMFKKAIGGESDKACTNIFDFEMLQLLENLSNQGSNKNAYLAA